MSEGCVFCDQSWMREAEIFIEAPHCIFASTRDPGIRASGPKPNWQRANAQLDWFPIPDHKTSDCDSPTTSCLAAAERLWSRRFPCAFLGSRREPVVQREGLGTRP